jgi:hypothetical protein
MNEGKEVIVFPLIKAKFTFHRQLLGDLEQRFNSLEEGSKSMVEQVMNSNQNPGVFLSFI